jgi:hypothetical protein
MGRHRARMGKKRNAYIVGESRKKETTREI